MKYFHVLFFSMLLYSCDKKDPTPVEPTYDGKITAELNGAPWNAVVYAVRNASAPSLMTITCRNYHEDTRIDEQCVFNNIPITPGTYRIPTDPPNTGPNTFMRASFFMNDYDVILAHYVVLDNDFNTLEIISYDSISNEIRGTADFTFLVKTKDDVNKPDTIRLKNGIFNGRVIN